MGEDLLICPFCGSKADIRKWSTITAPDGGPGYLPYCTGCGIHPLYSFFNVTDAVNWWNNRVIIDEKEEKQMEPYICMEELIKAIQDMIEFRNGLAENQYEQRYEDGYLDALDDVLETILRIQKE